MATLLSLLSGLLTILIISNITTQVTIRWSLQPSSIQLSLEDSQAHRHSVCATYTHTNDLYYIYHQKGSQSLL